MEKHQSYFTFLRNEYPKRKGELSFFLGNGINNYSHTTASWRNLLIKLAQTHISSTEDFGSILDDNSVTYPEFFDIVQLSSKDRDETFDYKSIKKGFQEAFNKWNPANTHVEWVKAIKASDRPILTTNYDYLLEKADDEIVDFMTSMQYDRRRFRPIRSKKGRDGFTPFYPWHSYYSHKKITSAQKEFAIWHIHGFCEYASSIRLGLSDYMGMVTKAKIWLHKAAGNPFHKRDDIKKWVGTNSWLDVFLNNHLLFIGIDLGSQETSLRWLLLEREKFYRRNEKLRKKTWYVVVKNKNRFPKGKKLLFDNLKIELLEANSYDQIYKQSPKYFT